MNRIIFFVYNNGHGDTMEQGKIFLISLNFDESLHQSSKIFPTELEKIIKRISKGRKDDKSISNARKLVESSKLFEFVHSVQTHATIIIKYVSYNTSVFSMTSETDVPNKKDTRSYTLNQGKREIYKSKLNTNLIYCCSYFRKLSEFVQHICISGYDFKRYQQQNPKALIEILSEFKKRHADYDLGSVNNAYWFTIGSLQNFNDMGIRLYTDFRTTGEIDSLYVCSGKLSGIFRK